MTQTQYEAKKEHLSKLRKQHKYHVIHDDSATKVNNIKQLIENAEKELKSYENRI